MASIGKHNDWGLIFIKAFISWPIALVGGERLAFLLGGDSATGWFYFFVIYIVSFIILDRIHAKLYDMVKGTQKQTSGSPMKAEPSAPKPAPPPPAPRKSPDEELFERITRKLGEGGNA